MCSLIKGTMILSILIQLVSTDFVYNGSNDLLPLHVNPSDKDVPGASVLF